MDYDEMLLRTYHGEPNCDGGLHRWVALFEGRLEAVWYNADDKAIHWFYGSVPPSHQGVPVGHAALPLMGARAFCYDCKVSSDDVYCNQPFQHTGQPLLRITLKQEHEAK
jgi:hypothetical protein